MVWVGREIKGNLTPTPLAMGRNFSTGSFIQNISTAIKNAK